jgi:thiol-disulfide isomerase/thioredoxin
MPYLVAAVVLVATVAVVDLLLTIVVIRRLRDHSNALTALRESSPGFGLEPGDLIPEFKARDLDERLVSRDTLAGREALLGFFSTTCEACEEQLPEFVRFAGSLTADEAEVVAVVSGASEEGTNLVEVLRRSLPVILESEGGLVTSVMEVRAFPTFYRFDPEGLLTSAGHDVRSLQTPAPA